MNGARNAFLALAVLALLAPVGVAQDGRLPLSFGSPVSLGGAIAASNLTWLSLDGMAATDWTLQIQFHRPLAADAGTNWTFYAFTTHLDDLGHSDLPVTRTSSDLDFSGVEKLTLRARPGENVSLYLHASQLNLTGRQDSLDVHSAENLFHGAFHSDQNGSESRRPPGSAETGAAALLRRSPTMPTSLEAQAIGVDALAWFNMDAECLPARASCPSGSGLHPVTPAGAGTGPAYVQAYVSHALDVPANPARLMAEIGGLDGTLVVGGPSPRFAVDGWARLPQAQWPQRDAELQPSENGTLSLSGQFELSDLARTQDGGFQAVLSGKVVKARLDERSIEPAMLLGGAVAAVAAGLGLVVLGKFAAAILAPWRRPGADRERRKNAPHPRRQHLVQLIQQEPGLSFRDILRATGYPHGVAQHHLGILRREGTVTAQAVDGRTRYFESNGNHQATWRAAVAQRSPDESLILRLVQEEPGIRQVDLVQRLRLGHAWLPSTAKYRIQRLEDAGLLHAARRGHEVRYRSVALSKGQRRRLRPAPRKDGGARPSPRSGF